MFDAAGEFSDAVSYTLVPNGKNSYAFTVTADAGWINAPDRVFPVTVDPTVMTKSESDDTTDTYVDEKHTERLL